MLPVVVLLALRLTPERMLSLTAFLLRPFPSQVGRFVDHHLRRFAEGLGALSGGSHLFWIASHSFVIWLVWSPLPSRPTTRP